MPKKELSAAEVWEKATFFSIDTNLIQAAGYRFTQGALHQLPRQLPESMKLQLPEIVVSEIVRHRMESVHEAHSKIEKATTELQRLTSIDTSTVHSAISQLNAIDAAAKIFTKEVHDYANQCRGAILPTAGADAAKSLFTDYFSNNPPFGPSKNKKSEFPDAMCLWLLEQYAEKNDTIGIVASGDNGWKQYAEKSDRLYWVESIDDLTAIFSATNDHANAIKEKIASAVADARSPLGKILTRKIAQHVENSWWDCSKIYTSSAYRVESEFFGAEIAQQEINSKINIWSVKDRPTEWVVELTASLNVKIQIYAEFFAWDAIDREEISLGLQKLTTQDNIDINIYLTYSDVHLETSVSDWGAEIEIADGEYDLGELEVELDYSTPEE